MYIYSYDLNVFSSLVSKLSADTEKLDSQLVFVSTIVRAMGSHEAPLLTLANMADEFVRMILSKVNTSCKLVISVRDSCTHELESIGREFHIKSTIMLATRFSSITTSPSFINEDLKM